MLGNFRSRTLSAYVSLTVAEILLAIKLLHLFALLDITVCA